MRARVAVPWYGCAAPFPGCALCKPVACKRGWLAPCALGAARLFSGRAVFAFCRLRLDAFPSRAERSGAARARAAVRPLTATAARKGSSTREWNIPSSQVFCFCFCGCVCGLQLLLFIRLHGFARVAVVLWCPFCALLSAPAARNPPPHGDAQRAEPRLAGAVRRRRGDAGAGAKRRPKGSASAAEVTERVGAP